MELRIHAQVVVIDTWPIRMASLSEYLARNEDACTLPANGYHNDYVAPRNYTIRNQCTPVSFGQKAPWKYIVSLHWQSCVIVDVSCHLTSCHPHTCHTVVPTNIIVECNTHMRTTTSPHKCLHKHVLHDLAEIPTMLMR